MQFLILFCLLVTGAARAVWLGTLERRLTQLRPVFDFTDGKGRRTTLPPVGDVYRCEIGHRGKAVGTFRDVTNSVPARVGNKEGDCHAPLTFLTDRPLPKFYLDKLTSPMPVVCGGKISDPAGWKEVKNFSAADAEALRAAFLKVEPMLHVCQQDPKKVMGEDPNQKELDIKLKPADLTPRGFRSAGGDLLAELTPKYVEMCEKPPNFTGRWFYLPKGKPAVDLGYDMKFVDYGDFNDDKNTDFLFSIFADGSEGYVFFDGKSATKLTFDYFCL